MSNTPAREEHFRIRINYHTARARRLSERLQFLIVAIAAFAWLCGSPGFVGEVRAGVTLSYYVETGANPSSNAVTIATPSATPTPVNTVIYTANPVLNSLSVFPPRSGGNFPSLVGNTALSNPYGIAYRAGNLYVTNAAADSITVYPASASGSSSPIVTISGSNTQLDDPVAIALDAAGNIYVANSGSPAGDPDSVTIYAAGSNGNVAPTTTITGPNTGLEFPDALTVDAQGNIYVANEGSIAGALDSITVYSSGSTGNSTPANVISGSSTLLASPGGVAVDSRGNIYATSLGVEGVGSVSVLIYAAGSTGNVAPTTSIDGDCAVITSPGAITLDSSANVYVTNPGNLASGDESIAVFTQSSLAPGQSDQCLTPAFNIFGPNTGIAQPFGIAVDSADDMYVTNSDADSITVFQSGSNGNVTPYATIASPNALLNPTSVAVDTGGQIYVTNAGSQVGGPDSVTIYPAGSNASEAPIATIASDGMTDNTGLSDPVAVAIGPQGGIYVVNQAAGYNLDGAITVYAAGSNGNVPPSRTIAGGTSGDQTGLNAPVAIAIGSAGDSFYVLNSSGGPLGNGSITVYAILGKGNVAPQRTITDPANKGQTQLQSPAGLALDSANNMYVTNDGSLDGGSDSITIYPNGSKGNVAPMAIISGSNTGLNLPSGIAVDSAGLIYVANDGSANGGVDIVTVYFTGATGNAEPIAMISGSLTGLGQPAGLALAPNASWLDF